MITYLFIYSTELKLSAYYIQDAVRSTDILNGFFWGTYISLNERKKKAQKLMKTKIQLYCNNATKEKSRISIECAIGTIV